MEMRAQTGFGERGVAHRAQDRAGGDLVSGANAGFRLKAGVGGDVAVAVIHLDGGAHAAVLLYGENDSSGG